MKNAPTINQDSRGIANQQRNAITKPSLRSAINKKCRECIYDRISGDGTWRQQVAACSAKKCPLYPVRPKPALSIASDLNAPGYPENGHCDWVLDRGEVRR